MKRLERTRGRAAPEASGSPPPSLAYLLSQLGFAVSAGFREALAPLALEPKEFAALRHLAFHQGESQQAVCEVIKVPPSRMVALVDGLEARGLVERRTNVSDRRARAIHLTDAGRDLLSRAVEVATAYERRVSEPLTATERERLLDGLVKLVRHLGMSGHVHPGLISPGATPWPGDPG